MAAQLIATNGNEARGLSLMNRLGDELRAGARLARHEHGRVRRSRLFHPLIDLPHLGAVAGHRAERAVLAQLTPERLHLAQRLEARHDLVEQNLQALDVHGLGQVVVGAFLHRLDRRFDRALRRQQQRRDVGALRLQRAKKAEAVEPWHHEIGDHDGRPKRRDLRERVFAVDCGLREKAPTLHELLQPDACRRVVFHDQHTLGG